MILLISNLLALALILAALVIYPVRMGVLSLKESFSVVVIIVAVIVSVSLVSWAIVHGLTQVIA